MRLLISSLALFVVGIAGPLPCSASAGPGIPEAFHGRVAGAFGARVSAIMNGSVVASTTIEAGGVYGYAPALFFVPDPDDSRSGALVAFAVDGVLTGQEALFTNGALTELDLAVPGTSTAATSSNATSTTSTGELPLETARAGDSTTPGIASPLQRVLRRRYDLTANHKVDLSDFAYMLANWGEEGRGTAADINGDGIVDLIDLSLLLGHWST